MTDRKQRLAALADRVEQLQGPDREVDVLIWWHVGPGKSECGDDGQSAIFAAGQYYGRKPWVSEENTTIEDVGYRGPQYTASLDAAMTLIGPESFFRLGNDGEGPDVAAYKATVTAGFAVVTFHDAVAATPALALCAAALRAQAETLA